MKTISLLILISISLISNPGKAQMYWNQAASFAGTSSSYIAVPNSSTLNITSDFTIEAWVYWESTFPSLAIIALKGLTGEYGLGIHNGEASVYSNGTVRLKSGSLLPINNWKHIAATCKVNGGSATFCIYIDGFLENTSILNALVTAPTSNSDSLYIGKDGGSSLPFKGLLDEIRIWNRCLSNLEILNNKRISLGTTGGKYSGLVMSMPFQLTTSNPVFSTLDFSISANHGLPIGVMPVDLSNIPSKTIIPNLNTLFDSLGNYLVGRDDPYVSPTSSVTLQAWIFRTGGGNGTIIHKGTAFTSSTNYSLNIINEKLAAKINGVVFDSQDTISLNEWTHVAFSYFPGGIGGVKGYRFFVNGVVVKSAFPTGPDITDGADSLYIGGSWSSVLPGFIGYIDEVRISKYSKPVSDIKDSMYIPMTTFSNSTVAYNLDGHTRANTSVGPFLYFRGNAKFSDEYDFSSPLNNGFNLNFQKGFYIKTSNHRIPENGSGGAMIDDTLNIFLDENISDVNVFVALNHSYDEQLTVDLVHPNGDIVQLTNFNSTNSHRDIMTIFDDQAATSLTGGSYVSFSSVIKPAMPINSSLSGTNTKGFWKIRIQDNNSTYGTGNLCAWGIQFNNKLILPKVLSCTILMQGFYNPASNLTVRDTMRCYLRSFPSPYAIVDSAKVYLQSDGSASFVFPSLNVTNFTSYYLQLKHRNSIETWSKNLVSFPSLQSQVSYDFTTDSAKAFGNNQIRVDNSPVKFAIYGGDVSQDGFVNLTDIIKVSNDGTNFITGYAQSDLNGDNSVNLTDLVIAANNSSRFVTVVKP